GRGILASRVDRVDVVVAAARRGDRAGRRERDESEEDATRAHAPRYRTCAPRWSLQARDQKCHKKETTRRGCACQARRMKGFPVGGGVVGVLGGARVASAGPCSAFPNPLVIESGDTQEPLLKALGQKLRNSATPINVLYTLTGSCTLIDDMYNKR